jgi:hypothetical protein
MGRLVGYAGVVVIAAGIGWTLLLQQGVRDGVFYSGDAGIKALMVAHFAAGEWHGDLRLAGEPWAHALWDDGFYPFAPTYVYDHQGRHYSAFPLPFAALTAPFQRALGFRGLHVLPLLATWLIWARFWFLGRRLEVHPGALAAGLVALVFASHLTLYSAFFWEHTLAVAFAFMGVAEVVVAFGGRASPGPHRLRLGLAGLLLGLSLWLRPECIALLVAVLGVTFAISLRSGRLGEWIPLAGGAAVAVAGFIALNQAIYGIPLGIHALRTAEVASLGGRLGETLRLATAQLWGLALFAPIAIFALAQALPLWRPPLRDNIGRLLLAIVAASLLVTFAISPNDGDKQWGPRYLLPIVPLLCFAAASFASALLRDAPGSQRRVGLGLLAAILAFGAWINVVNGTRAVASDYAYRVRPALDLVRESNVPLVVVSHQWQAQELSSAMGPRQFFWPNAPGELDRLIQALGATGRREFLWIEYLSGRAPKSGDIKTASGIRVHRELLGVGGRMVVYRCTARS